MSGIVDDDLPALVAGRLVLVLAGVSLVSVDALPLLGLENFRAEAALVLVLAVVLFALNKKSENISISHCDNLQQIKENDFKTNLRYLKT
jgi:hypothetical protein